MRKTFLILLMTITISFTINGLVYGADNPSEDPLSFPYSLRETSEGVFIELPLDAFKVIILNGNTAKKQLDALQTEYNHLVDHSVPATEYNDLYLDYGTLSTENTKLRLQRRNLWFTVGFLGVVAGVLGVTQ